MKAWWVALEARIDGLTLRERVFLFIACIAGLMAVGYTLWLAPAQQSYRQVALRVAGQATELGQLQAELKSSGVPNPESVALYQEINSLQERIDTVNREIQTSIASSSGSPDLEQVLVQFLRRQEGLTLVGIGNMKADGESPAQNAIATTPLAAAIRRSGMELRVSGPYGELVRYVKTLETAMPQLRWGPMQLTTDKQKNLLSLQVYLVGVQQ